MRDMNLLGLTVKDKITGFVGVVVCVSYDIAGSIQALVAPPCKADAEGKLDDRKYFYTNRLTVLNAQPVMEVPSFTEVPGGEELPLP